jgi:hypothetical protein
MPDKKLFLTIGHQSSRDECIFTIEKALQEIYPETETWKLRRPPEGKLQQFVEQARKHIGAIAFFTGDLAERQGDTMIPSPEVMDAFKLRAILPDKVLISLHHHEATFVVKSPEKFEPLEPPFNIQTRPAREIAGVNSIVDALARNGILTHKCIDMKELEEILGNKGARQLLITSAERLKAQLDYLMTWNTSPMLREAHAVPFAELDPEKRYRLAYGFPGSKDQVEVDVGTPFKIIPEVVGAQARGDHLHWTLQTNIAQLEGKDGPELPTRTWHQIEFAPGVRLPRPFSSETKVRVQRDFRTGEPFTVE